MYCNNLFISILGKRREVSMASYRIQNILQKSGYIAKIINPIENNIVPLIDAEIKIHHKSSNRYVTILKCAENMKDKDFTYINKYIRNKGVYVRPCGIYAVNCTGLSTEQIFIENDKIFQNYKQVNLIFDVNADIKKQFDQIELFTVL